MNNSEKIYLGIIGILCYVLYFKANKKTTCPSCNCEPTKTVYVPTYVQQPNVVKPEILEEALIYTGPLKFEMKSKTDVNISYLYFVKDGKYYKTEYNKNNATEPSKTSEITIKEIIDAWNSIK